jgi:hypothetical protein
MEDSLHCHLAQKAHALVLHPRDCKRNFLQDLVDAHGLLALDSTGPYPLLPPRSRLMPAYPWCCLDGKCDRFFKSARATVVHIDRDRERSKGDVWPFRPEPFDCLIENGIHAHALAFDDLGLRR